MLMMFRRLCRPWQFTLSVFICMPAQAVDWPLVNFPSAAVVEPMGDQVRHNGYLMKVQRFIVNQPAGQVLQFFQTTWKASKPNFAKLEDWHVLTKEEGNFVTTVELKEELSNRTQGVLATRYMQDIHTLEQGVPRDIPIYSAATISSLLESDENGRKAVTITLMSKSSAFTIHKYYLQELKSRGWTVKESRVGDAKAGVLMVFIDKSNRGGMVQTMSVAGLTQSVIHVDNGN